MPKLIRFPHMRPLASVLGLALLLSLAACTQGGSAGALSHTGRPSPSSLPSPHPRLAASDSPLTTPDGQALFLFQVPGDARLRGVSWDGSANGLLSRSGSFNNWSGQSPDGRYLVIGGVLYDRHMTSIGPLPWPDKNPSVTWSPDSTTMCKATPASPASGSAMSLSVARPGGTARTVARGFATYGDNASYPVMACDPARDRAIVGEFGQGIAPTALWVIRLSTGEIVRSIAPVGAWAVASSDASVLALSSMSTPGGQKQQTVIERTDDGTILGTVNDFSPQGFSWDKSLMVGATGTAVVLLDWRTGRRIWSASGRYGGYSAEPNGSHMAVGIGFVGGSDQADVYLVGSDGSSVLLPERLRCALEF